MNHNHILSVKSSKEEDPKRQGLKRRVCDKTIFKRPENEKQNPQV